MRMNTGPKIFVATYADHLFLAEKLKQTILSTPVILCFNTNFINTKIKLKLKKQIQFSFIYHRRWWFHSHCQWL